MDKTYRLTRIKLSLLYFGIIFFIVLLFSVINVKQQYDQFSRFDNLWNSADTITNPYQLDMLNQLHNTITDIKRDIILHVAELDIVILISALLVSYYLSGETLEPIKKAFEKQKQFISDASHELRTPLTSIKTEAEVLVRSQSTTLNEYKEFNSSVIEEVDRLTALTNTLLNLAKTDNNAQVLNKEILLVKDIIDASLSRLQHAISQKHLNVDNEIDNSIQLLGDKTRLIELFTILLDNAIKYNNESGEITINTKETHQSINITITDTGMGIEKNDLSKIFDRFYRITSDRNEKGFGLGLSIAKEIVREHNGQITIQSEKGKGTQVTLSFPRIQSQQ